MNRRACYELKGFLQMISHVLSCCFQTSLKRVILILEFYSDNIHHLQIYVRKIYLDKFEFQEEERLIYLFLKGTFELQCSFIGLLRIADSVIHSEQLIAFVMQCITGHGLKAPSTSLKTHGMNNVQLKQSQEKVCA